MKNNRSGKAAIFAKNDIAKIRKHLKNEKHRLIFEIALFTGERMGAVTQLKVSDVYADARASIPHDEITFAARTRKARPDGSRQTRQIPIHPTLIDYLKTYKPPENGFLFPGGKNGKSGDDTHITTRAIDKYWRSLFVKLGFDKRGFSTHSPRRWLINELDRNGVGAKRIQKITGHKNINVLMGYIETNNEQIKNALSTIEV
jgi:integrase/recombinase XerD